MRFTNKVVLVTGGGSGIGRAAALAFAEEGAAVVVVGRSAASLDETVTLIHDRGGSAGAVTADVTREADAAHMVEETVARHGGLHVAFNNVGILVPGGVTDLSTADWTRAVDTNLTSMWLSMKHEITHMRANGGGTIVNTASNLGAHGRRAGISSYVATKAAVSALTRNAAREHIAEGVRINAISPGPTDTPMSLRPGETPTDRAARLKESLPIGRVGALAEITSAVLWLASDESGFAVGHDLVLDGGATA
jgi:NAD(P)-dependent dehydrogenase (short-subunit alcohol dehydrogenase family)